MCWCWGFRESPGDRTGHAGTFYIPLSIFFYLWTTYSFVLFYAPSFHTIRSVQMQLGVRHCTVLYCLYCTVLYYTIPPNFTHVSTTLHPHFLLLTPTNHVSKKKEKKRSNAYLIVEFISVLLALNLILPPHSLPFVSFHSIRMNSAPLGRGNSS